jgi:hypothetical protein
VHSVSNPERALSIREVSSADDPDVDSVCRVYAEAFPPGPLSVAPDAFKSAFIRHRYAASRYKWHLWAVRATAWEPVEGMASFFTFPAAGFGGYITLAGRLRSTGRLRPLITRMEERMMEDRLGAGGGVHRM